MVTADAAITTATIAVTDLVASTELRASLGEDEAERVRRAHDRTLDEAITRHRGTTIKGLGDGVLALFGGAADAIAFAKDANQAMATTAADLGTALHLRTGISSGDVTLEDGDCFGTPVVEASRLCAAANTDQVLVADVVRTLARGRGDHAFEAEGTRELKGLDEPVTVWSVPWTTGSGASLHRISPFVGRAKENQTVDELVELATSGSGKVLLVSGEPGAGKTRLVKHALTRHVDAGEVQLLWAGCHEGESAPLGPFADAVTSWARSTPPNVVEAAIGTDATALKSLTPVLGEVAPNLPDPAPVEPDAAAARLQDAMTQWLGRIGATKPVVLVIDDLHWADDATVRMFRTVARAASRLPLLLVGMFRHTDLDRTASFTDAVGSLQREAEPVRLSLTGLDSTDVHTLLERLAGHDVPSPLATRLAEECNGNPFFIRETLLHLVEDGQLAVEDGQWVATGDTLGLPEGVREVLGRRLARLSSTTNDLLRVGALFEGDMALGPAAAAAGIDEGAALDAIDEALDAQVVEPGTTFDSYRFVHALFRHTLAGELNPSRQVRAHRAIAEQLLAAGGPPPHTTLARHYWLSAALPGAEQGVEHALAAADEAEARAAHREAYDAMVMARELSSGGFDVDAQRRLATLAVLAQIDVADQCAEVRRLGEMATAEGLDAADEVKELAWTSAKLADITTTWALADEGRRLLDPDRRDETWALLRMYELDHEEYLDSSGPGLPLDTPARREVVEVTLTTDLVLPLLWVPADVARRKLETAGPEDRVAIGNLAWASNQLTLAVDNWLPYFEECLANGILPTAVFGSAMNGRALAVLGRHDEADAAIDGGLELLPRISPTSNAAFQMLAAIALIARVRGEQLLTEGVGEGRHDDPNTRWASAAVLASTARERAERGRSDAALDLVDMLVPVVDAAAGWAPNYPLIVHLLVETLWVLDRDDHLDVLEANLLTEVVEPGYRYTEVDGRWTAALCASMRDDHDGARTWFEHSREVVMVESPALLANVELDAARAELRRAEPDSAFVRGRLDAARAAAAHPAMAAWLPRIDEVEARLA